MQSTPDNVLNRLSQKQLPWEWAWAWFAALPTVEQQARLAELADYIQQAHPTPALVQQALAEAPVKPTATPLVLLRIHGLLEALRRIRQLPPPEYPSAFRAMLSLFSSADAHRRRTECQHGCSHDWHNLPPLP